VATAENSRNRAGTWPTRSRPHLTSSSHPVGSTSVDATPSFTWTQPADDLSGMKGYDWSIERRLHDARGREHLAHDLVDQRHPGAGTWYLHLRTIDESGKRSVGLPPTDRSPSRPPIRSTSSPPRRAGWAGLAGAAARERTPRRAACVAHDADGQRLGHLLERGRQECRWAVRRGRTRREAPRDGVDGPLTTWSTAIGAAATYTKINRGPVSVRGGRHTLGVLHDAGEEFGRAERDRQRHRGPVDLDAVHAHGRSGVAAPRRPSGRGLGCAADRARVLVQLRRVPLLEQHGQRMVACGLRVPARRGGRLRLPHAQRHVLADTGFAGMRASSSRPAGRLDAVLINRNVVTSPDLWDVGVVNASGGAGDFTIRQVPSTLLYVATRSPSRSPPARCCCCASSTSARGCRPGLPHGTELLERSARDAGMVRPAVLGRRASPSLRQRRDRVHDHRPARSEPRHPRAITRSPSTATPGTHRLINLVLEIERTPSDLVPYAGAGWHSPLVPRPAFDGTPASTSAPDTLLGNMSRPTSTSACATSRREHPRASKTGSISTTSTSRLSTTRRTAAGRPTSSTGTMPSGWRAAATP